MRLRSARKRVIVARGYAEFLQRVECGAHRALECVAFELVVVVEPVQCDVGLIAASTVDRAAAAVVVLICLVVFPI